MTGSLAASVTELISLGIIITTTLNHLNDFGLTVAAALCWLINTLEHYYLLHHN